MSNKVTVTYYGVEGTGRNVTEAKRDAGRKIEASLTGSYDPTILACRGIGILVYRQPNGWDFRTIVDPSDGIREGTMYGCGNYATHKEAVQAATNHLAQMAWVPEDGYTTPVAGADAREFRSWVEFQLRYREARSRGMSDSDCHSYACRNPARAELWAQEQE